jgi:NTP pyrophosphatase (non-canonical NTP hydrolase)
MELNEYQKEAINTAIYPKEDGLTYAVLGLVGESGEIAEKMKKMMRDSIPIAEVKRDIGYELGDVLWYIANLANEIGMTLDEVATLNLIKVKDRTLRHKIQGNGDYR